MLLEPVDQIARLDLHMIEIELHPHIGPADLGDDRRRLLRQVQQIVRPVAPVERLDQDADAVLGGEIGGAGEIGDERALPGALLRRHPAGHAVDRRCRRSPPQSRALCEQRGELRFAPGHAGDAALARRTPTGC